MNVGNAQFLACPPDWPQATYYGIQSGFWRFLEDFLLNTLRFIDNIKDFPHKLKA